MEPKLDVLRFKTFVSGKRVERKGRSTILIPKVSKEKIKNKHKTVKRSKCCTYSRYFTHKILKFKEHEKTTEK